MKKLLLILALCPLAHAYTYVGSAAFSTSLVATATYTCTAGNSLVVVGGQGGFTSFQPADVAVTSSSSQETFQKAGQTILTTNGSTNYTDSVAYWLPSCVGGPQTYTIDFQAHGSGGYQGGVLLEFSGLAYDHVPSIVSSFASQELSAPTASLSTGSITTTVSTFQAVYGLQCYQDGSGTISSPGYTLGIKSSALTLLYAGSIASGTINPTVTTSNSGNHCLHVGVIAFGAESYPTTGFVQDAVNWNYSSSPFSTAVAASLRFNVVAGHTLYVSIQQTSSNTALSSVVSALGNACSLIFTGANSWQFLYACPVTVGGAETITVTPGTSINGLTVMALEYVGYGSTVNASGNSGSSSSNPTVASLTSTSAAAVVSFMSVTSTTRWPVLSCTSGLAQRAYSSNAGGALAAYDELEGSGGTYSNSCSSLQSDGTSTAGSNFLNSIFAFTANPPAVSLQIGVFLVGP